MQAVKAFRAGVYLRVGMVFANLYQISKLSHIHPKPCLWIEFDLVSIKPQPFCVFHFLGEYSAECIYGLTQIVMGL